MPSAPSCRSASRRMYVAVRRLPRSDNHSAAATALRHKRVCPHLRKQGVKYRLFFRRRKKKQKSRRRLLPRLCPGLKAPGRNYKLLPALLAFSPPDCLRSASRPQRFKVSVKLRRVASLPYEIKLSAYKSNDFYKKMRFTGNETH